MLQIVAGRLIYLSIEGLHWHYPLQNVIGSLLSRAPANLPLWNPHMFAGSPLAGDPQAQLWYPPAAIYRLLPYATANGCFLALHLLLAVMGTVVFLREVAEVSPRAAALGGLAFGIGGHASFLLAMPVALSGYAWLPWVAVFCSRLAVAPVLGNVLGLGLVGGWMVLAGDVSAIFHGVGLAAVIVGVRGIGHGSSGVVRALAGAGGIAVAISAVFGLSFIGYAADSIDGLMGYLAGATADRMHPRFLVGLVLPAVFLPAGQEATPAPGCG